MLSAQNAQLLAWEQSVKMLQHRAVAASRHQLPVQVRIRARKYDAASTRALLCGGPVFFLDVVGEHTIAICRVAVD